MKTFSNCILFAYFIFLSSKPVFAQIVTIPLTVSPISAIGMCLENRFSASFNADGQHILTITADLLRNNITDTIYNCTGSGNPKIFIEVDSASTTLISNSTDTLGGSWTGEINDTSLITIWYHVYLDCSSVHFNNSNTTSLNLLQTFTDANPFFYYTGSGTNTFQTSNIKGIRFITPPNPSFTSSYLDTTYLDFYYINPVQTNAAISFLFRPDSTNYCGMLTYDSLQYSIGLSGPFLSLTANTLTTTPIGSEDTLVIRQLAFIDTCITFCDSAEVYFRWQCAQAPSIDSIFCNNCTQPLQTSFSIQKGNLAKINIERITPTYQIAANDNSCFNDTTSMQDWHFRITNSGVGALDSLRIILNNGDTLEILSLIPQNTFSMVSTCAGCVDTLITALRINYLCEDFVPDAMRQAILHLRNFGTSDTIDIFFSTFRCASDSSYLFNMPKALNSWTLNVLGKGICEDTASLNLVGSPFFPHVVNGNISSLASSGFGDLPQSTVFNPVVADLTVPKDSTFGQTATLELELTGGISGADRQLVGCMSPSCPNLNGYLKAVIETELGLVIRNPLSDVKIKMYNSASASYIYLNPIYYNTLVPSNTCVEGEYSIYFDLSNPIFKNVLDSGIFEFTLQACCNNTPPVTDYTIKFYILPDPNSCDSLIIPTSGNTLPPSCTGIGCTWIPVILIDNHISVHCPGCVTPGMMVDNYILRRTSFGLQDGNNNGLADSVNLPVVPGTSYFNSHNIKTWHSTIGDGLEDLTVSHFQEGDATTTGYSYQQMIDSAGVRLNYLQLSRKIPNGLDTMLVNPLSFTFYVDEPDFITPNCVDCGFFGVDSTEYRTTLAIHVPDSLLNLFLDLFPVDNAYLFSFESRWDSVLNQYTGNLHDHPSLITHSDTVNPFGGFFESQHYRLHATYRQCGTKITRYYNLFDLKDIALQSEVQNKMWLSGAKQNHDAFGNIPTQPDNMAMLNDSLGLTLFPNDPDTSLILIDSTFANDHIFYCSGYGKFHYFFFQNVREYGTVVNDETSCDKRLTLQSLITTKATNIRAFPFEYRPTPLWHNKIDVTVPNGYYISQSQYRSGIYWGINAGQTPWQPFNPPAITGTFTMQDSAYMRPLCFYDPYIQPDSNAYTSSEATNMTYLFTLSSDSCFQPPLIYADSSVIFNIGLNNIPCMVSDSAMCDPDPAIVDPSAAYLSQILVTQPNLNAYFTIDPLLAMNHQVCFDFVVTNYTIPLDSPATVFSTGAANVFLALPDSASIPFLQNWIYYGSNGDTIFASGQIIPIDSYLNHGDSLSGRVCASYISCQDTIEIPFDIGWNCDGFPLEPFDTDSVCDAISLSVILHDADVNVTPGPKQHEATYTLCESFEIYTEYGAANFGGYIPQLISLSNLDSSLIPQYAFITYCDSTTNDTLSFNTSDSWNILGNNLAAIGIADSALNFPECIRVTIGLLPTCEFAQMNILPDIILFGQTFCGDTIAYGAPFVPGTIEQDSSICTDCFTIEKTALQSGAFELTDTVTFQIVVCGNNQFPDTVIFNDQLPLGFNLITTVPDTIFVPNIGCDTIFISGFYDQTGSCGLPEMLNTATIYFDGDSLSSSDCISVYPLCASSADTILVDSTFTSSMPTTVTGFTIFLAGRLYVDDLTTFVNCTILVNTGGQIIVLPGSGLVLDSTVVEGCDAMWQGVLIEHGVVGFAMKKHSVIRDASCAVNASDSTSLKILHSSFENNVRGIYVPEKLGGGLNNVWQTIQGTHFGMTAPFKDSFPGQPPFGSMPYSGIEVNDVIWSIGDVLADSNYFYTMNTGILGHRSVMKVDNNKFINIQKDTSYHNSWDGAAIASIGKLNSIAGKLRVRPLASGNFTVERSLFGIYTDYSVLDADRVDMTSVNTGVFVTRTEDFLQSLITRCTIFANSTGINFNFNPGASMLEATDNTIILHLSKSVGIRMFETNNAVDAPYSISRNTIIGQNSRWGIVGYNLLKPLITENTVRMSSTLASSLLMDGISVNGSQKAKVACNEVKGESPTDTNKVAIKVILSDNSEISCNVVDSTGIGIYFDGASAGAIFRANTIHNHFEGLRLTGSAVISPQSMRGNMWTGTYGSGFGAVNLNSPNALVVSLNRFEIQDSIPGTIYHPLNFVICSLCNWFVYTPGQPDECTGQDTCIQVGSGNFTSDDHFMEKLIAADSIRASEYEPEAKSMTRQYLFDKLKENPLLILEESEFEAFMSTLEQSDKDYLYRIKKLIATRSSFDSQLRQLRFMQDSLTNILLPIIQQNNALILDGASNSAALEFQNEQYSNEITQVQWQIKSLLAQFSLQRILLSDSATIFNNQILPEDLIALNEMTVNELELQLLLNGSLSQYQIDQLEFIALQCPVAGGNAVFRARARYYSYNPDMEFEDQAICSAQGYYRNQSATSVTHQIPKPAFIRPNPASSRATLVYDLINTSKPKFIISDLSGRKLFISSLNDEENEFTFSTNMIPDGMYIYKIMDGEKLLHKGKFTIQH